MYLQKINDPHTPLKALLSMTCDGYEMFYSPLHPNLKSWIEKNVGDLSLEEKSQRLDTIWKHGIDTLKIRRGYLPPFGADAETCYREQELWSYAVFTAALINSMIKHFDPSVSDVTAAILPPNGLAWLKSNTSVFTEWHRYVQENDKKTAFYLIEKQLRRSRKIQSAARNSQNTETL